MQTKSSNNSPEATDRNAFHTASKFSPTRDRFMNHMTGSSPKYHVSYTRVPQEDVRAFSVERNAKIPEVSTFRSNAERMERMDSLLTIPAHKGVTVKFDSTSMQRNLIPLTQEDKEQSVNLPLLNHLRQPHSLLGKSPKGAAGGNPPSFYEADQDKWRRKFAQSVLERTQFKKKYLSDRKTSVLNHNDNLLLNDETDWDQKLKKTQYTGGQLIPTKSEFKQVLKRRKSRQSTDMPS